MKEKRAQFTLSSFCRPVHPSEGPVTDWDLILMTGHHIERVFGVKDSPLLLNDKHHAHVAASAEHCQPRKAN